MATGSPPLALFLSRLSISFCSLWSVIFLRQKGQEVRASNAFIIFSELSSSPPCSSNNQQQPRAHFQTHTHSKPIFRSRICTLPTTYRSVGPEGRQDILRWKVEAHSPWKQSGRIRAGDLFGATYDRQRRSTRQENTKCIVDILVFPQWKQDLLSLSLVVPVESVVHVPAHEATFDLLVSESPEPTSPFRTRDRSAQIVLSISMLTLAVELNSLVYDFLL